MNTERVIIVALLLIGAAAITVTHFVNQTAPNKAYVRVEDDGSSRPVTATAYRTLEASPDGVPKGVYFSWPRTLGLWMAGFFTLALFSFLYKDNPFYKLAEHAFVGISAAYWMVVAFWSTIVPNLLGKLFPLPIKFSLLPQLDVDDVVTTLATKSWFAGLVNYESAAGDGLTASWWQLMNLPYIIPLILGVMLLWRLSPKGGWIARWPLAFILGTTAGIRMTGYLESDFVAQINATILPLVQKAYDDAGNLDWGRTFYYSMNNCLIVIGVLCGLIYFFFSLEHRGITGRLSRVGIWVLMITFGAGFGYTVMGRIALLSGRFEFLVFEWLNLVPK